MDNNTTAAETYLVHGIGEEGLQGSALAGGVLLEPGEDAGEIGVLFALREDLKAEVVIPHVFLVDVEHGEEDVKEVAQDQGGPVGHPGLESLVEDLVEEEDRLRIQKDGAHVLVSAGRPWYRITQTYKFHLASRRSSLRAV